MVVGLGEGEGEGYGEGYFGGLGLLLHLLLGNMTPNEARIDSAAPGSPLRGPRFLAILYIILEV